MLTGDPAPNLVRGIVLTEPDDDELVDVMVASFDEDQKFADCIYMPRGDQAPGPGSQCLVAFDDIGAAWVIAWQ